MALNIAAILNGISLLTTAARKAVDDLRKFAASTEIPQLRDEATRAADEIEAMLASTSLANVTASAFATLQDAVLKGKSIVQHTPTDTF